MSSTADAQPDTRLVSGAPTTLFDKIWDAHVVQDLGHGWSLLHVDRHLLHDLSGTRGLRELAARQLAVRSPELTFATFDHVVSTAPGRTGHTFEGGRALYDGLDQGARAAGIRLFELGRPGQGIVHVIGPELGLVQPGMTVVCGDSHTCTNGAFGALAFGIGTSELTHVLATQTIRQRRPRNVRILVDGRLPPDATAKDLALHILRALGSSGASGCAVEYAGRVIEALGMDERMTLCNMSVEMGAKYAMVAPDATTFDYLRHTAYGPPPGPFEDALRHWRTLRSDPGARFDLEHRIDAGAVAPSITWGTSPDQNLPISGTVPAPADFASPAQQAACAKALDYMGLRSGAGLRGTPVDRVFIGSCTNSRLSDLHEAARLLRGRRVAPHVQAWVVPGSELVKRAAEADGTAEQFRQAGFDWREPGCSMCVAANGETAAPGQRVVSTSNRNFVGRQGPGVRTHLASPATAAASALAGVVCSAGDL